VERVLRLRRIAELRAQEAEERPLMALVQSVERGEVAVDQAFEERSALLCGPISRRIARS
jgi:hypothetical protein